MINFIDEFAPISLPIEEKAKINSNNELIQYRSEIEAMKVALTCNYRSIRCSPKIEILFVEE